MTAFDAAVAEILESEGVWSNDPNDSGGKTKYGITEITLAEAKRRGIVPDSRRIEDVTKDEARDIYRAMYWMSIAGDLLPPALAFITFDAAVNQSPQVAIRQLQAALGVNVDGVIGQRTLWAATKSQPDVQDKMLAARARRYFKRTIEKPSQVGYLDGWLIRCFRIARQAERTEDV